MAPSQPHSMPRYRSRKPTNNGLAPDMLALIGLGGFGEAAGIIVGAMAGGVAMQSLKRLGYIKP